MKTKRTNIILSIIFCIEILAYFIYPEPYYYLNDVILDGFNRLIALTAILVLSIFGLIYLNTKFPSKKRFNSFNYLISLAGVLFLILITFVNLVLYLSTEKMLSGNTDSYQKLSNMFSVIQVLVSALAFGALIITTIMQSKQISIQSEEMEKNTEAVTMQYGMLELQKDELKLQREELTLQREEMSKNTQALLLQKQTMDDQKNEFETTNRYNQKQEIRNMFAILHENVENSIQRTTYKRGNSANKAGYSAYTEIAGEIYQGIDVSNSQNSHGIEGVFNTVTLCLKFMDDYIEANKIDEYEYNLFSEMTKSILTPEINLLLIFKISNTDNINKLLFERSGISNLKNNLQCISKVHSNLIRDTFSSINPRLKTPVLLINILKLFPSKDLAETISPCNFNDSINLIVNCFNNNTNITSTQKYLAATIDFEFIKQKCISMEIDNDKINELNEMINSAQL